MADGLRYIKAAPASPIIPVVCSNGFTMLNPALNLKQYLKYFKHVQFDTNTEFGVAHDCKECLAKNDVVMDEENFWVASIHLDQSQCPCYKPSISVSFPVFKHSLPSVRESAASQLFYEQAARNIVFLSDEDSEDTETVVPSSCAGLADGSQFIMPSEEVGEIIHVNCYQGWTVLNPSLDRETLPSYFTSWLEYTDKVVGPSFDDFATWRQWFSAATENTEFSLSEDCTVCAPQPAADDVRSGVNQVYHMTGNYYLCAWGTKGDCDMDLREQCYSCVNRHGGNDYLEYMSGTCTHLISHADQKVYTHHDDCTGMSDNSKPSLGLNNKYCACYRDVTDDDTIKLSHKTYSQFDFEIPVVEGVDTLLYTVDNNIVHLCTDDFVAGTYRITNPGTYILDCDIEFEPNPPLNADENPNDYNEYGWFPLPEQEDDYATGFIDNSYVGEYQLGFIAAVTIESDNVVFDLNGYTIEQSKVFYLQQRFFSVFLLNNKNFIEGQGPVFFGAEFKTVSNIIIKNGVIGRSSHHGILSRQTSNLLIEDISFHDFDVAGISLSGFDGVIMRNLDIGPNNQDCPVTGRYLHARAMLPRYKQLVEEHGDQNILINGEKRSIRSVIDRVVDSMNVIYNKEILGYEYDEDDELYQLAMLEFGNDNISPRVSDGSVVYGVLLNGYGGAVMGLGSAPKVATGVQMENVNIHDFVLNPIEKCKFALSNSPFTVRGPFADVFDADMASFVDEDGFLHYVGTPFSDAQLAFARATTSWSALSHTDMGKRFQRWTSGELQLDYQNDVEWSCNTDIQLHVQKGPIGLRVDGISDVRLSNIAIQNLVNIGELGDTEKCGAYLKGNGHQDSQVQLGYTGTDNFGMVVVNSDNVVLQNSLLIDGMESHRGIATGLYVIRDATLTLGLTAKVTISNIHAGTMLAVDTLSSSDLPNKIPVACAVNVNFGNIELLDATKMVDDYVAIAQETVTGHSECLDSLHLTDDDLVVVPSACNNMADGLQYILPYGLYATSDYPLLPVMCSNGDTILDPSLSFETYEKYFSSLYMYDVGIGGPALEDFATWRTWFLPFENRDIKAVFEYGVSEDCNSCAYGNEETDDALSPPSTNNAYYMTGNFYLCAWITKGDCDMDAETYECFQCSRNGQSTVYPGVCSHLKTGVDTVVHTDHYQCTGNNDNLKPSIGTNGQFCACYRPQSNDLREFQMNVADFDRDVTVLEQERNGDLVDGADADDGSDADDAQVTYLSSEDFLYGTYRITTPGTYVLTEDITINFNEPSSDVKSGEDFSPNSYDDLYWMPKTDGSQDELYMGASTWSGPYQLGFFAAITIETSDVVLDLNGFEIGMSVEYYLQQRVFSIIELAAKNFVSGQGPVDFGPYLRSASNVVIKDGTIGLASHHGVHGNGATDVTLSNLRVYNFDVAGIQLNGFDGATITDCDVGPSSSNIPVTGRYLHARVLLRRYAHLVDTYGDEELAFDGRESRTVREYVDELVAQMDMVYQHVINGAEYTQSDSDDEEYQRWLRAVDLFMNPNENGYGDGGVVYGVLLNSRGGAVMGFGNAPSQSNNAVLDNVYIHDLAIAPLEKLKFKTSSLGGATRGPVADVFDIMKVSDGFEDISTARYVGTAYSDVQLVMSQFEKSWFVLDHTCFDEGLTAWALNGQTFADYGGYYAGCNTDIQLHINKGVIGLRLDNIVDFTVSNTRIENLLNTGGLGVETEMCGAYTQGNAHQDPLITAGYTGTEGYGITVTQSVGGKLHNININNIETHHGAANGIALFKDSSVDFNTIVIDSIVAGSQLDVSQLRPEQNYLPNKVPIACSIFDNNYNTQYTLSADDSNAETTVKGSNINGFLLCAGDALIGDCDDDTCVSQFDRAYLDQLTQDAILDKQSIVHGDAHNHWSLRVVTLYLITIGLLAIVAAALYCYNNNKCSAYQFVHKSVDSAQSETIQVSLDNGTSEQTPLLS
eukprot:CAMPEP_0202688380 /NCGR_PEP_ID=MMETSP1385-20130828/3905_1 /ASSEMBLY_ACC=CAM_ASM_000861 /TAXON_ID=933848 /ORGANISM="Elphidium margaritaceum" /LENGTH=1949 /DNA_ID=CAMNT_0049343345 /DNA_START=200 /DNA_END=6049 /DNA_ORIENTATION=+